MNPSTGAAAAASSKSTPQPPSMYGASGPVVTLASDLAERTADWFSPSEEHWVRCTASDDMLDAFVAALVARAAATGRCQPIPSDDLELAKEEGWIALPHSGSLDQLT